MLLTRHRSFALLGALSVLLLLAVPAVAWAQSAPLSSPDPQVWVTNGGVLTTAIAPDGTNYIGGSFSYVGPKTGCGVAVNATNGTVQTAFPEVQGPVCAVAPDGSGGFYVGGHFSSVGGVACKNVVHILAGGSLDTTFDANASASDEVYALAVSGSTLYVGGSFDTIGGQARNHVAALDTTSGDATTWNPGADGTVYALAVSGSTVYAGGAFTTIGGQSSNHLAALDATSGAADTTFAANASANNDIRALAVSDSTVYAGGAFTTIGGQSCNYLAALDATSGAADTTFDANASAGGDIYALAVSGSTLYVGGSFASVGGLTRNNIAALDATSGDATTWNPDARSDIESLHPDAGSDVESLAVSGSTVYVGGAFTTIGGQERNSIAALDATSGDATTWNPGANSDVLALAVTGSTLYVGGNFSSVGGLTRNNIAALDGATGAATSWDPDTGGANGSVLALAVSGSTVYAGGEFTTIGGRSCNYLAALDATSGVADTTFDANANAQGDVEALAVSGSTLYVGGNFDTIGGQARNNVAALDATSGDATTWNPDADGTVYALAVSGSTVYAGGEFTTIGGQSSNYLAALDATSGAADTTFAANASANNDILALAVSDSTVYAGGAFTTIGGQSSNYLAALDATSGAPDTTFDANASAGGDIYALAVSGSTLYVGGHFNTIGGQPRNNVAALDATSGDATTWNPDASSDIEALAVSGSTVYVGGYFGSIGVQARYNNFFGLACFSPTPALNNLTVSAGSLSPAFASGTLSYTDSVANGVTSLTVTPTADDSHASYRLRVGGVTVSNPIALSVGNTTIDIVVSAQDGVTDQTYVLTVTRATLITPHVTLTLSGLKGGAVKLGKRLTVKGTVKPSSLAGGKVSLTVQRKVGAKWRKVKTMTAKIATGGAYRCTYGPTKKGSYRIRVTFARTAANTAAATAWKAFRVK
ncbi:MAG TPA: cadherin-like beta sandwich domain-containing protein [Thermoleophilia bacterium]|nr:cadherin-like beta sandwich domain-containing protein [Thermoleophilia bacterium]